MSRLDEPAGAYTMITHGMDFETCFVTQRGRGLAVIKRGEMGPQKRLIPPKEWGDAWAWNVLEDGSGIYLRRT